MKTETFDFEIIIRAPHRYTRRACENAGLDWEKLVEIEEALDPGDDPEGVLCLQSSQFNLLPAILGTEGLLIWGSISLSGSNDNFKIYVNFHDGNTVIPVGGIVEWDQEALIGEAQKKIEQARKVLAG